MYISASGVLTSMYRQDVLSNNLANLGTAGFKADVPVARQRLAARQEDGLDDVPSNAMMERLGAGVLLGANQLNLTQGALETTGRVLDVAIRGQGFFVVRDPTDAGGDGLRLTRDGRFERARDGTLVDQGGRQVLDDGDSPIVIPDGPAVRIGSDGAILQGEAVIARLRVARVDDPASLARAGQGLLRPSEEQWRSAKPATGEVLQHHVEQSGVDEVSAIMQIASASRAVDANIAVMQHSDRMTDRAINAFARVV